MRGTLVPLALLAGAAWAAGGAALTRFIWPELRRFERVALELIAGFGIVALILSAALLLHAFAHATAVLIAVAIAGALAARGRRRPPSPAAGMPPIRRVEFWIAISAVVAC